MLLPPMVDAGKVMRCSRSVRTHHALSSFVLGILVIACGSSPPPPAPIVHREEHAAVVDAAELEPVDAGVAELEPAEPDAPADAMPADAGPPPSPSADLLAKLPIVTGPVPGAPALIVGAEPSKAHCGGTKITVVRTRSRKVPAPDPTLATVMLLEFPGGLDFNAANKAKQRASIKRFDDWIATSRRTVEAAKHRYRIEVFDTSATPSARTVAAARMVQIYRRYAELLGRAEIPKDVRTDDVAIEGYCDSLTELAEPLLGSADRAINLCRSFSADGGGSGWWDTVCAEPAPAP